MSLVQRGKYIINKETGEVVDVLEQNNNNNNPNTLIDFNGIISLMMIKEFKKLIGL